MALTLATGGSARSAPKPMPHSGHYSLDILGFNEGTPYRLAGAQAEAVLDDPGAVVFRFRSRSWMDREQPGTHVTVTELGQRFASRPLVDLVAVYRLDLDRDGKPEVLLVPDADAIGDGPRYAPTLLELGDKGYLPRWSAAKVPGERYRLVDIRDLNGDNRPEILLAGEAGSSGYYQFHELLARSPDGLRSLSVRHVDSVHYVDLDQDKTIEIVVRERVGRRGPAYQWTYVDHVHRWDGTRFVPADRLFPRYHDEQTLPTLLGDLIDHAQAKLPILMEKVEAIRRVRQEVLAAVSKPGGYDRRVVPALAALQKGQRELAARRLRDLFEAYPYEPQVLLGLAQLAADDGRWDDVLDHAVRALTVEPQSRRAWWWAGVAFSQVEERSSAVASFHNAVILGGTVEEGLAFLRARRGEPGTEGSLQRAVDQVLSQFAGR